MNHTLIRQAATGVQGHGGRIRFSHCDIFSCQHGVRLSGGLQNTVGSPEEVKEADINFYFLNVYENVYGISLYGKNDETTFVLSYSKIENNDRNGIQIKKWDSSNDATKTALSFIHGSVSFNKDYGFELAEGLQYDVIIFNSSFERNEDHGVRIYQRSSGNANNSISISETNFTDNKYNGVELYCHYCDIGQVSFLSNYFTGHSQEAVDVYLYKRTSDYNNTVLVKGNKFVNNARDLKANVRSNVETMIQNNSFIQSQFAIEISSNDLDKTRLLIHGNEFVNTSVGSSNAVLVDINSLMSDIRHNVFLNCSIPSVIFLRKGFEHVVSWNKFQNSSSTSCYVKLDQSFTPDNNIVLDKNYWGTTEKQNIKQKICDFFHDSRKTMAHVNSFYPTNQLEILTSSLELDTFRYERDSKLNAYIVGGIIKQDLDLSVFDGENIIVNRSIMIREGTSVSLGHALVNFTSARGLAVLGKKIRIYYYNFILSCFGRFQVCFRCIY